MGERDIIHQLESEMRARREYVRRIIAEQNRPDVLAEYDRAMRDLDLGITGARNVWHSISEAQRRALEAAAFGPLFRWRKDRVVYSAPHRATEFKFRLPTIRNLIARNLLDCDGGVFDPEAKVVLSDRGRFVLRRGPEAASPTGGSNG